MEKPVYKNETILFFIASIISLIIWGAIGYTTQGYVLIIIPFFFLAYLFAQSGFISYLRGQGALVSDSQYPDIQARVKLCAEKTGLTITPRVYILSGNGMLNAFATTFLRRHYIVLLSDVLDGLEDKPDAINFYIGHEMGHLDRKHLYYQPFLAPALCLPLLGAAYSRAREYTCDMYGALCCPPESAMQGLALLAVGPKRYKTLNVQEYMAQTKDTSGFWMSFHELVASYPWLTKRYTRVAPDLQRLPVPSRNPLAYLFALFVPRLNLISVVVLYFVFLALLLPSKLPGMDMLMGAGKRDELQIEQAIDEEYKTGEVYDFGDGRKFKYLGGGSDDRKNWEEVTPDSTEAGPQTTPPADEAQPAPETQPPQP